MKNHRSGQNCLCPQEFPSNCQLLTINLLSCHLLRIHNFVKVWLDPSSGKRQKSHYLFGYTNIVSVVSFIRPLCLNVQLIWGGWKVFGNAQVVSPFGLTDCGIQGICFPVLWPLIVSTPVSLTTSSSAVSLSERRGCSLLFTSVLRWTQLTSQGCKIEEYIWERAAYWIDHLFQIFKDPKLMFFQNI